MSSVTVDLVLPGTPVEYHGSLTPWHGEMIVENFSYPIEQIDGDDVVRYTLRYGKGWTDYLRNVRPGSFTVLTDKGTRA